VNRRNERALKAVSPASPAAAPTRASHPRTQQRLPRTLLALVVSTLAAAGLVLTTTTPAHAEDGYRYWNYAHLQGEEWTFADTGPGDFTPEDGAVEGWRYGTSTVSQGIYPRADLAEVSFDSVCEGSEAADGEKRVAVLVDFGTEADAAGAEVPEPVAECAVVPADANGQQALESVVEVRQADSMTCALDGYPAQGCGEQVANAEVSADEDPVSFVLPAADDTAEDTAPAAADSASDEAGFPWALVAVLAAAAVLAALAVPMYRRKQSA
jgi:hypothetical protein